MENDRNIREGLERRIQALEARLTNLQENPSVVTEENLPETLVTPLAVESGIRLAVDSIFTSLPEYTPIRNLLTEVRGYIQASAELTPEMGNAKIQELRDALGTLKEKDYPGKLEALRLRLEELLVKNT